MLLYYDENAPPDYISPNGAGFFAA